MLITFIGLFIWVLLPGNKKRFDEAAQAPFADAEEDDKELVEETHSRRVEK
ncbi:cbb3-type cytochrome c oxidase subunit 3 [Neptunomonas marina]|uniref:Cbb3-type cytochrome c oxidase subunit 3 n=2 Tax=Oceanospirillaceae TaxID=135620 RepID=A0A437Q8F2_9GAMM|nr:cbb3-type cytochrome c oxidase subunit 3 [Neptunomonas marina]